MKILTTKLKRWNFKQRLQEIEARLQKVSDMEDPIQNPIPELEEALQIVSYWNKHMKDAPKPKPIKKVKPQINIFS